MQSRWERNSYFPSKYHVLTVLSDIQLHKIMAAQDEVQAGRGSIRDVLHRLMHSFAEELGHSPALTRSLLTAFLASDTVRTLINTTMRDGRAGLTRIIASGQRRGEIRRDQPAAELALLYQQEVVGTLLLWGMQGEDSLPSRLESTFKHFWTAMAAEH
jgi:AcrR family transcriptional regulator